MIFDILHCALLTAEKAVKVMKQRKMEEDAKAGALSFGNEENSGEGTQKPEHDRLIRTRN